MATYLEGQRVFAHVDLEYGCGAVAAGRYMCVQAVTISAIGWEHKPSVFSQRPDKYMFVFSGLFILPLSSSPMFFPSCSSPSSAAFTASHTPFFSVSPPTPVRPETHRICFIYFFLSISSRHLNPPSICWSFVLRERVQRGVRGLTWQRKEKGRGECV